MGTVLLVSLKSLGLCEAVAVIRPSLSPRINRQQGPLFVISYFDISSTRPACSGPQVRALSVEVLSLTSRSAPPAALRPLLPALVPPLLEALSSLEDAR